MEEELWCRVLEDLIMPDCLAVHPDGERTSCLEARYTQDQVI